MINRLDDKDVSLNRPIKMWDNVPIDTREVIDSINELDNFIQYPYIGMIFYSKFEDDYYRVLSLEDGYRDIRAGKIYRKSQIENVNNYIKLDNYFVGSYEQFTLKGNSATMIKKAEIRNGYLYITFYDGQETNVGYVIGDPGYCPQITEDENNDLETITDLIYKLNIKFCDEDDHLLKTLVTPNLIGPYVVNIEDEVIDGVKTGYTIFTLNNKKTYKVGPYGIKNVELVTEDDNYKKDLIITFNDDTVLNLGNVRGDKGTSIRILGTLKDENDLPKYANNGECYIIDKYLYFYWEGKWENVGKIVGDDGKTPNITVKTYRISPKDSDTDKRTKIKVEFFNEDKLINDSFYIYESYSPTIKPSISTDNTYQLIIQYMNEDGTLNTFYTPNLKGEDGTSINIKGSISQKTDLTQYYPNAELGDAYIVDNEKDSNDGHLWVYTEDTTTDDEKHFHGFLDVGKIKGPQGDPGEKGNSGEDGYRIKLKIENKILKYCYIDKNDNEMSPYVDLIEISEITGPQGVSPVITIIENDGEIKLKIVDIDGEKMTPNLKGENGDNGISIEMRYSNSFIQYRRYYVDKNGNTIYPDNTKDKWIDLAFIPTITQKSIEGGVELTIGDTTYIIRSAKNIKMRYRPSQGENDPGYIQWQLEGDNYWNDLISIDKLAGKSMSVGSVTTGTVPNGNNAEVNIVKNESKSNDYNNVYDFTFTIPEGIQGNDGKGITKITSEYNENNELIIYFTIKDPKTNLEEIKTINAGNIKGEKGDQGEDGNSITNMELKSYDSESDTVTFTITFDKLPSKDISITGLKGKKGDSGVGIASVNQTTTTKDSSGENIVTVTLTDGKTSIIKIYNGAKGEDGTSVNIKGTLVSTDLLPTKDVNKGDGWLIDGYLWVYTGSTETSSINGFTNVGKIQGPQGKSITNVEGNYNSENILESLVFTITDPATDKSTRTEPILIGNIKGSDGKEIELGKSETTIQWRYVGEEVWKDLITLESITGPQGEPGINGTDGKDGINGKSAYEIAKEKGFDGSEAEWLESLKGKNGIDGKNSSVSIIENENNTDDIYKLDISYTNGDVITNFTTPNLKGDSAKLELYKILNTLPDKNTEELNLDINHIYMILKDGKEIVSKEANYDKYIILNIAEDKTITWEKIETTEASGNILVLINGDGETEATLPDIEFASTNFIYCLLTPEYQRGLNIGLTNDNSANKNFYEEWIVIETETEKKWELLGPQIYRISASMIDYIWKFADKFTVYDDWDIASDIPEYQKKHYGDATPLNNFIFRLVPSGSTYNLILVKEVSGGKINKLSIAPQYKVKLNGTTYTCTVTELDGTYNDSYTYYESDSEGNVSIKTYSTEEEFGTQSVFSGVEVYGVYVADTVKKITRGFLYTSNMSAYHIPYDLEIIGDYAFYSTKSPTVQFEKLINNGKDVEAYPLEESKVKAIGVHAFDGNSNLAFLIRNEDGTTKDSNIVKTPATLKKIGDYAFYNTRIATLDTNLSSNLYIGDHAFVQCVHGGQTLSPTTYYTDATFLGVNGLTHDTINYSSAGVSNWFEGQEHAGHNYNFDSEHETDVLHVTLTSVDPDWSLQ